MLNNLESIEVETYLFDDKGNVLSKVFLVPKNIFSIFEHKEKRHEYKNKIEQ